MASNGNRDTEYQSLQLKLEKRFRQGGTLTAGYTWSKNIGDIEAGMSWLEAGLLANLQANNNLRLEHAVAGFDVPQRLIVSYVYDLPFGKSKPFFSGVLRARLRPPLESSAGRSLRSALRESPTGTSRPLKPSIFRSATDCSSAPSSSTSSTACSLDLPAKCSATRSLAL